MYRVIKPARRVLLPLVAVTCASVASAQGTFYQPPSPAPTQGQSVGYGASSDLSRWLSMLAREPNSVVALTGAGRAALELGDGEAALTFFGRAEERAPQDGAIKAGIGSAMSLMEQPEAALQFFYQATRLGVPAVDMAAYRGLAYDLTGDPQRAQQDYRLALGRRDDPEVRRRLALSLAISGQRDAALVTIEPQIRQQDRAAWRTRAFVLALTGDSQGANRVVEMVMPYQAAEMAPFLARLPTLSLADRARAVHFGHFPGSGTPGQGPALAGVASAQARSNPATSAGRPDSGQPALGSTPAPAKPSPSTPATVTARAPEPPRSVQIAGTPSPVASVTPVVTTPAMGRPVTVSPVPSAPPLSATISMDPAQQSSPVSVIAPPSGLASGFSVEPPAAATPSPPASGTAATAPAATVPAAPMKTATTIVIAPAPTVPPAPRTNAFADIGTLVAGLKDPVQVDNPAATGPTPTAPRKTETAPPREPSRNWVQLARSSSPDSLPGEFRRLKARAPKLFTGKSAWTVSQGSSNRLLVGPFKSNKEAQDFVNELKEADLAAFSWTSASGQEIKKLPAK